VIISVGNVAGFGASLVGLLVIAGCGSQEARPAPTVTVVVTVPGAPVVQPQPRRTYSVDSGRMGSEDALGEEAAKAAVVRRAAAQKACQQAIDLDPQIRSLREQEMDAALTSERTPESVGRSIELNQQVQRLQLLQGQLRLTCTAQ
jgi:hypothetical protein